jgi:hypothetical protein
MHGALYIPTNYNLKFVDYAQGELYFVSYSFGLRGEIFIFILLSSWDVKTCSLLHRNI